MGICFSKDNTKDGVPLKQQTESPAQSPVTSKKETSADNAMQRRSHMSVNGANKGEVTHKSGSVESKYEIGKELGRGGFSIVKECTNKFTGEKVAIKFIDKKYVDQEELKLLGREIDIMEKVHHKNVLQLIEIYETDIQLSLVMELVNGGELFYKIVDKGSYSEEEARNIIRQLVEGVDYLHNKGVAHRDLKPENLLCSEDDQGVTIKIADFGLSRFIDVDMGTSCGTPDYAAPEVLRMEGTYDKSVDLWSLGVITYVVLCGFPPFYGSNQHALFEKILNADYDFPDPEWTNISDEAKDFIRKLLVLDTEKRATAKQCLDHPWLTADLRGGNIKVDMKRLRAHVQERAKANQK